MTDIFLVYVTIGVVLSLTRMSMDIGSQPLLTLLVGVPIASMIWPLLVVLWIHDLMHKK